MDADEAKLLDKLRKIEALREGATTDGERSTAEAVAEAVRRRLRELEAQAPPREYSFTFTDPYAKRVFVALCRRYGIEPYRYKRQRWTSTNARVTKQFLDETLWPTYEALSHELHKHLDAVTDRIIQGAIHQDTSDAKETAEPKQLG